MRRMVVRWGMGREIGCFLIVGGDGDEGTWRVLEMDGVGWGEWVS